MSNSVVLERLPAAANTQPSSVHTQAKRQRVFIFLTRYGLIFSVNLLVMLIGAINYNNSLAYALTFLLGGLFLVAMLHTYSNLSGLVISALPCEAVFVGQQARFPLLFDNRPGKFRLAIGLQAQSERKKRLGKKTAEALTVCVNIPAHSMQTSSVIIDAGKRGFLDPGRIRISSTWPLGFFRAWSYMHGGQHCVVYPEPRGSRTLPEMTMIEEEEQSGKGSGTEDFVGVRQYRTGDSMRALDWKAYARERGLLSKRFSGKGSRKILLDWQYTSHIDDPELRLSQLCLWVLQAEKQQAQYALLMPGVPVTQFANGNAHKHQCLQMLAGYGLDRDQAA